MFQVDLRDMKFVLFDQLGLQNSLGKAPYEDFDRETVEMLLEEAFKYSRDVLWPLNDAADTEGVKLVDGQVITCTGMKEAFNTFREMGWIGLSQSPEFGGQGAPIVVGGAANELFEGACLAFNLTRLLTDGCAHLIETFGTDELKNRYVENMYTGTWTGTMCLTEAGAGSDVGSNRTTAVPEGDHYLIEGEKIFITSGAHDLAPNVVHAVLARTPDAPPGTKGLSLFVVPTVRVNEDGSLGEHNNVNCPRIEEKLGIHGSPTCVLNFGDTGPCHGWLLGEELAGMAEMFQMMNEARLSVGFEGVGIGNAAYLQALSFANERIQGRDILRRFKGPVAIVEHPDVRDMLAYQKACGEGIRALAYWAANLADRAKVEEAAGNGDEAKRLYGIFEVMTPVVKAYCTDTGFKICDRAVQTHGGYGYTKEYPAERFLRDVRICSIYEGTNGIQALDLLGRKMRQNGGADAMNFFMELQARAQAAGAVPALASVSKWAGVAIGCLGETAQGIAGLAAKDPALPLLRATKFLDLCGDTVAGVLLSEQAAIAYGQLVDMAKEKGVDSDDDAALRDLAGQNDLARFLYGKLASARYFAENILGMAVAKKKIILGEDRSAMDIVF